MYGKKRIVLSNTRPVRQRGNDGTAVAVQAPNVAVLSHLAKKAHLRELRVTGEDAEKLLSQLYDNQPTPDEAERLRERADELDDEATRIDLDECDWSGKAWKLREQAAELRRKAEAAGRPARIQRRR